VNEYINAKLLGLYTNAIADSALALISDAAPAASGTAASHSLPSWPSPESPGKAEPPAHPPPAAAGTGCET